MTHVAAPVSTTPATNPMVNAVEVFIAFPLLHVSHSTFNLRLTLPVRKKIVRNQIQAANEAILDLD
jgi:hypothetical protein